jgi:hypothetical protein
MVQIVIGLWWLLSLPGELRFMRNIYMWAGAGLGLVISFRNGVFF